MSVRVWFYNPEKEHTTSYNFINKIVARLTPPFCHVELQFPDGDACSIVMHDTVHMRKRTFDPDYYTCVTIPSTALALQSCKALVLSHCQRGTPFGCTRDSTFCSKLVAELLSRRRCRAHRRIRRWRVHQSKLTLQNTHAQRTRAVAPETNMCLGTHRCSSFFAAKWAAAAAVSKTKKSHRH
jgi:hypothetical protein